MRARLAAVLSLTAAALLDPRPARADVPGGGVALNQLDPAPAGDAFFGLPSPTTSGHLVPRALLMFDYASRPLVVTDGATQGAVVAHQAFLHINASLSLFDRVLITALFPIAVAQGGESPTVGGVAFTSPSAAEAGDLRIGARVRVFGDDGDPFQAGVGASLYFPTGPTGSFAGEGAFRLAPHLALGGRLFSLLVWDASIGAMVHGSTNPATLTYGAGVAASLFGDRLQVGPEAYFATPLQDGFLKLTETRSLQRGWASNAELLVGVRGRIVSGLVAGVAAGPGLSGAIGSPSYRVVATLGWSPAAAPQREEEAKPADTDGDGMLDAQDACPYAFGEKSADARQNGCPAADRDEDGVPDGEDACPDVRGEASSDVKRRGCPPDRDEDGVPDLLDACPDQKGGAQENGCPAK